MLFLEKIEQKRIYLILITIISILTCVLYAGFVIPKSFISSASIILVKTETDKDGNKKNNGSIEPTKNLISTLEEILTSETSLKEVKDSLNMDVKTENINVSIKKASSSDTLQINSSSNDYNSSLKINSEFIKVLENKVDGMYKDTGIYIVNDSHILKSNTISKILISILVGIVISIIIDVIYIFILIGIEKNIKNEKELENNFSLKNLSSIPVKNLKKNNSKLISSETEKSLTNTAFKSLRSNIQFVNVNNKEKNIILVTSSSAKEGKSYVSANLAISYANVGQKVILIDADLNSGTQNQLFDLPNDMGLSNYLSGLDMTGMELNERINSFIKETTVKNLNIITSGSVPPNSSELLSSSKLEEMIKDLSVFYDVIILDSTSILNKVDSLILSRHAKSILIVIKKNTKKDDLWKSKRDIQNVGGRIIGIVSNKVKVKEPKAKEEKFTYKAIEFLKEKIKICIQKIKENKKQKLLDEAKTEVKPEIAKEDSGIKNEAKVLVNAIIEEKEDEDDEEENESTEESSEKEELLTEKINKKEKEQEEKENIIVIKESDFKEVTVNAENTVKIENEKNKKLEDFKVKFKIFLKKSKRKLKKFRIKSIRFYRKSKTTINTKITQMKEKNEEKKKIKLEQEIAKQEELKKQASKGSEINKPENIILVVVDPHNESCRAFSKECYTEKLVRGLDRVDGFVKAQYSSYLVKKRIESLMIMYSINKKQASRVDPLVYATLIDYDDCVWISQKKASNKAEEYVLCMAKEYSRNDKEKRKEYNRRCINLRKEALYSKGIEIEYNMELLWKSSKMRLVDKITMNKFSKKFGKKSSNLEEEKNKIIQEIDEELKDKPEEMENATQLSFPEFMTEESKREEKRKESEILKKIQKEKAAKKREDDKLKRQQEKEKRNKEKEEIKKNKEIERLKKIEEARIEEELLVDNLYPKTKYNKNI